MGKVFLLGFGFCIGGSCDMVGLGVFVVLCFSF